MSLIRFTSSDKLSNVNGVVIGLGRKQISGAGVTHRGGKDVRPGVNTEQPMIRDGQKLLGRCVIETTRGHDQEVRVIGEGSRVMFDYPYNHILNPENSDTSEGWHRELRLMLADAASEIKTIRYDYPHQS